MGRLWIHDFKEVPSTHHIYEDQNTVRECYKMCLKPTIQHDVKKAHVVALKGPEKLAEIDLTTGDKKVLIGEDLSPKI